MLIKNLFNWKNFSEFTFPCFNLIGIQITIFLPYFFSAFYIGQLADPVALGSFGIASTFLSMFFNSIILGAQEHLGMKGSTYFSHN